MKKIKHLMIWMGLLLSMVSCKDTVEAIGLGGDDMAAEGVTLHIQLPNFSENKIGTRADGNPENIDNMKVVFYGEGNTYKGMADCSSTLKSSGNGYDFVVSNIPADTKTIHLVANASDLDESEAKNLQDISVAKQRTPDYNKPICWGAISISDILDGKKTVDLLRQCAKITLNVADDLNKPNVFPLDNAGLDVRYVATKAAIAPADYQEHNSDNLPTTDESNITEGKLGGGTSRVVAVNETSAGHAFVLIKAKYKDKEGYYKVALYAGKDADNNYILDSNGQRKELAILRNHNYTITVTKVNDYGYETEAEAINSAPENRLEVEVVDDNPEIVNMIACKDYELGVSEDQSIDAKSTTATITLVTTLPKATQADGKLFSLSSDVAWLGNPTSETSTEVPVADTDCLSSKGMKYVLTIPVTPNNGSEQARAGVITIQSGDLVRQIKITQRGYDFRRDDNRKVIMQNNGANYQTDYFNWIDNTVQGIKPEDMRGAVRNEGLHFSVGNNTYSYLIPKLEGDRCTHADNRFTVVEAGNYWKVTLNNNSSNFDIWQSQFTITNKDNIAITYSVYHTGIFHEMTNTNYQLYQLAEEGTNKVSGWFYYGVVKVQGKAKKYLMLDRNLGATNNGFYAPDTKALSGNKGAIGGYFYISKEKNTSNPAQGNLSSTLCPSGFVIPTNDDLQDIIDGGALTVNTYTTSAGEPYNCVEIKTIDSGLPIIYLPLGGYLEDDELKNPYHVNLWSQTLLSGNQGFSPDSPEYGYWYRYFDVYNKKISISNMRFVSGSYGKNTGNYKAMPIRLIYGQYIQ